MILTAIFTPKPGHETALLSLLHTQAQHSWQEPGILSYAINEVTGEQRSFMNVEVYESADAFQIHEDTEYTHLFKKELVDLVASPPLVYVGATLFVGEDPKSAL